MTEPIDAETPTPMGEEPVDESTLDPRARAVLQKARREAQNLRTRLHEAEEMIGAQAARETEHQRAMVAAAAKAAGMIDPSDFLTAHPDPAEFLDEEFNSVLPDKVAEATAALLATKPHLGRPVGPPPSQQPIEGLRPGASPAIEKKPAPTWHSALHGR